MRAIKILEIPHLIFILGLISLTTGSLHAQAPQSYRLLRFQYMFQWPMADLQDRFGANNSFGGALEHVNLNNGWFLGGQGTYIFGNNVKEDVISHLRVFDGTVIGIDGLPGDVNLKQRGYTVGLYTGKVFSSSKSDSKQKGIRTEIGLGLLQHKIRVQDNFSTVVALEPDYLKGYDRMTNGLYTAIAAGYQYHNPLNNVHFQLMGELIAARTGSRRSFDHATGGPITAKRWDLLAGIRLAYVVTISRKKAPEDIYY